MTDQLPKIAALIADAFQEEEYFFPKVALNEAGYQVEVVSSRKQPVEIYSYFARTGLLDVERAIADARPEDYVGVLIPAAPKALPCSQKILASPNSYKTSTRGAESSPASAAGRCWQRARRSLPAIA